MVTISEFLVSLKETILNLGVFSIIAIVLILILLIILMVIEKKLEKKIIIKKDRNNYYAEAVSGLKDPNPDQELGRIDNLTREFLKERFGIKKSEGYSELKDSFSKDKKKELSDFCSSMNDSLYSGNPASKSINIKLISALASIIRNNPIPKEDSEKETAKQEKDRAP